MAAAFNVRRACLFIRYNLFSCCLLAISPNFMETNCRALGEIYTLKIDELK